MRTIASPKVTRSIRNFTPRRTSPPVLGEWAFCSRAVGTNRIVRLMSFPELELTNRVAVVVGATSGIGKAIALGLADAGASVVPTGRRSNLVHEAVREVEVRGRGSLAITS